MAHLLNRDVETKLQTLSGLIEKRRVCEREINVT